METKVFKKIEAIEVKTDEFLQSLKTSHIDVYDYTEEAIELLKLDWSEVWGNICASVENADALHVDIIYYYAAMEYLSENDSSLQESMSIASELGYTVDSLNSELLASLLATEENQTEFYELEKEVEDFFSDIQDELTEMADELELDVCELLEEYENQ